MSWSTSKLRVRLVPLSCLSMFKLSSIVTDRSRAVLLLWIYFCYLFCFVFVFVTHLFVPCSLVITYWERADLLARLCVMFSCVLSQVFHMVSRVRCGTWLYRYLIFAFFNTFIIKMKQCRVLTLAQYRCSCKYLLLIQAYQSVLGTMCVFHVNELKKMTKHITMNFKWVELCISTD